MRVVKKSLNGVVIFHEIDGIDQLNGQGSALEKQILAESKGKWPLSILPLKLLAKNGDRGAGDIIARVIGPIGGNAFTSWYKKTFGLDCGCGRRQETLNARWPL